MALGVGLVLLGWLVPRPVLRREQQISDQWRQAHDKQAELGDRQTELLQQVLAALEDRSADTGRHRADS